MVTQPETPMSTLNPIRALYPFAEVFRAKTDGTEQVDVWNIPPKTIITMVLLRIVVAGTGTGANIIAGDDDSDNGFILAASICGVAVGTIYGDAVAERGSYLAGGDASGTHGGKWKVYESAGKELKIDSSAALTTECTVDIFVFGYRYET